MHRAEGQPRLTEVTAKMGHADSKMGLSARKTSRETIPCVFTKAVNSLFTSIIQVINHNVTKIELRAQLLACHCK